jgi:hypothetical protein
VSQCGERRQLLLLRKKCFVAAILFLQSVCFCSDHFLLFISAFAFNPFGAELLLKIIHNALESDPGFSVTHRAIFARSWINWILEESHGFFQTQRFLCVPVVIVHRIRDFLTGCAFGWAMAWQIAWKVQRRLKIFVSSISEAKARRGGGKLASES